MASALLSPPMFIDQTPGCFDALQTTVVFTSEQWGVLCGHTWTFSARAYNQVGASGLAQFTNEPFKADGCGGG